MIIEGYCWGVIWSYHSRWQWYSLLQQQSLDNGFNNSVLKKLHWSVMNCSGIGIFYQAIRSSHSTFNGQYFTSRRQLSALTLIHSANESSQVWFLIYLLRILEFWWTFPSSELAIPKNIVLTACATLFSLSMTTVVHCSGKSENKIQENLIFEGATSTALHQFFCWGEMHTILGF